MDRERVRRFYDRLGAKHDLGQRYERQAKDKGLALLAVTAGERVLNVGAGTGKEHCLLAEAAGPNGLAVAIDISRTMLTLTRRRSDSPVLEADAFALPFPASSFDALYCSYVLDLVPGRSLEPVMRELHRVVGPGGRLALVSLTEGVDVPSQVLMSLWRFVYRLSPVFLGGCRPIRLTDLVTSAGLTVAHSNVVVQGGVPSEVVLATKPS
jgi:demethylmenaquinone methyltransferase/2-methoxy-6-polyprenyl-1,4-benzoquinol methylase